MNGRVESVLRAAAASAIRSGNDEEHARACAALDAWLGRLPSVTMTAHEGQRAMTSTERSRARRGRISAIYATLRKAGMGLR